MSSCSPDCRPRIYTAPFSGEAFVHQAMESGTLEIQDKDNSWVQWEGHMVTFNRSTVSGITNKYKRCPWKTRFIPWSRAVWISPRDSWVIWAFTETSPPNVLSRSSPVVHPHQRHLEGLVSTASWATVSDPVEQWSPTFFGRSHGRWFFHTHAGRGGFRMTQGHYIYCVFYFWSNATTDLTGGTGPRPEDGDPCRRVCTSSSIRGCWHCWLGVHTLRTTI